MKRSLLALSLIAALPFAATAAEGVSYNYVQGGYVATNGDGNGNADGFGIDGSVAVHPNFHIFGGYNTQDVDNTNIDVDQWKLGVGYNYEIAPKADLVTRTVYKKVDAGSGFDVDGYSAELACAARWLPTSKGMRWLVMRISSSSTVISTAASAPK